MVQLLLAVQFMHEQKIIHRDLSLDNILYDLKAESPTPKIIDFGRAIYFDDIPSSEF